MISRERHCVEESFIFKVRETVSEEYPALQADLFCRRSRMSWNYRAG